MSMKDRVLNFSIHQDVIESKTVVYGGSSDQKRSEYLVKSWKILKRIRLRTRQMKDINDSTRSRISKQATQVSKAQPSLDSQSLKVTKERL